MTSPKWMWAIAIRSEEQKNKYLKNQIQEFHYEHQFGELRLPLVWITAPVWDTITKQAMGREHVWPYPYWETPDDAGQTGLNYGNRYFFEGFQYPLKSDRSQRADCFRTAEVLYLHSMQAGNAQAMVKLGDIYENDRCEGYYWECCLAKYDRKCHNECRDKTPACHCEQHFPRLNRAFEYFEKAAALGNTEATYKLGDMYLNGTGCEQDRRKAFDLYLAAFESSVGDRAYVCGNAAYRIALCYENAWGTDLDFAKALEYYLIAEVSLAEAAVADMGENFENFDFEKNLGRTRKAIKRLKQELAGTY